MRRESARIAVKPAIATRVTGASVPPQNITSARPSRIESAPSPIDMFEAAQAVHCEESGPLVPSSIETWAAPMFGMIAGIENGFTRSGPRSRSVSVQSWNDLSPPIPVATDAPTRSASFAITIPLSASAWRAAAMASCAKRSIRRAVLCSIHTVGSKSCTSHAKWTSYSESSNCVIGPAPDSPAIRFRQVVS